MNTLKSYLDRLDAQLASFPLAGVELLTDQLIGARKAGSRVFLCGNGGSATTASHAANDWMVGSGLVNPSLRVVSLNESIAQVTAIGNDDDYGHVFSRPLELLATKGDLLVVFSASGKSTNVIKALKVAREIGVRSFSILGFDGGAALELSDFNILFQTATGEYGIVEDLHLTTVHMVKEALIASSVLQP